MNRALITGLGGQDGSYLAELLLDLDYHYTHTYRSIRTWEYVYYTVVIHMLMLHSDSLI